jgi:hypothetical protein
MTDVVLTLDGAFFRGIPRADRVTEVRSDEIPTLASKFDLLADVIEQNWSDLPVPIKDLAKTYAYYEMESAIKVSFFARLRFAWFMSRNMTSKDEVGHLLSSMTRLKDAVFSAIERESSEFNLRLNQALESEATPHPMTAEQFRAWTKNL